MTWRNVVFTISFLVAVIVGLALWETGTYSKWGTAGLVCAIMFGPSFMLRAYNMWINRDMLQTTYHIAQAQFSTIKAIQREKKKQNNKVKQK